jgi:hypothetical protein
MYQYIYDHFLSDKKYEKTLTHIEGKITDLGIKGKINKLTLLKNVETFVRESRDSSQVLVVVGNDNTVSQVLNSVAENNLILGIIPIGEGQQIANFLGIKNEDQACDILSARNIEVLDLGQINNQYFLSSAEMFGEGVSVFCDDKYEIKTLPQNKKIGIYNLCMEREVKDLFDPQDGQLELVSFPEEKSSLFNFKKQELSKTILKIKQAKILSREDYATVDRNKDVEKNKILIDNYKTIKTPATIHLADKKLRVIVGKERGF